MRYAQKVEKHREYWLDSLTGKDHSENLGTNRKI
jgi:hypothetical protein